MRHVDPTLCVISVDVESDWAGLTKSFSYRGVVQLATFLRFAQDLGVRGTIFVTADAALATPIVQVALESGFEIASHGFNHQRLDRLTVEDAADNIRSAAVTLSEIVGDRIYGFRAPFAAVNAAILQTLCKEGFLYDSSILTSPLHATNIRARRLRLSFASSKPIKITFNGGSILEFPISVSRFLRIPLGSYYLQLFGCQLMSFVFSSVRSPIMFYTHSWTLGDVPPPTEVSWLTRRVAYRGAGAGELRCLKNMLLNWRKRDVQFVTSREVMERLQSSVETIPIARFEDAIR